MGKAAINEASFNPNVAVGRLTNDKPTTHTPRSRSYAVKPFASIADCAHAVTIEPSSAFFLSYSRA